MSLENQFIDLCLNGKLNEAKEFYKNNPTIDISANSEYAFKYACANGHLEIAQWLYTINPTINISADDEIAFKWACVNGYLEVVQWLFTIKPDINISAENECAFRMACNNGHLEVAQWLLSIKPTINISAENEHENDHAFRYACVNGRLEIAQWLQSLLPDKYDLVIENNKITSYSIKCVMPFNTEVIQLKYTNKEDIVCFICYDEDTQVEVQTNCGHNFCSKCITDYYNKCYENCQCPYCRQIITSFNKLEIQLCELSN